MGSKVRWLICHQYLETRVKDEARLCKRHILSAVVIARIFYNSLFGLKLIFYNQYNFCACGRSRIVDFVFSLLAACSEHLSDNVATLPREPEGEFYQPLLVVVC